MKFFQFKITLGLALGESWPLLAQPQKNTDVYKGMLPWEGLPDANLQKLYTCRRKQVDVNSWIKFRLYNTSFCASEELVPWERPWTNTMALIQAFSLQATMDDDCSTKAICFSAQLVKLQCCHMLARWIQHTEPSPPVNQHWSSMKFFQLKITLGLALGESWPLLAQP